MIKRALISVTDKTHLEILGQYLHQQGVEILASSSTAVFLTAHDIPVTPVEDYTGFAECFGGRLKTLHPKIHGGILGRRGVTFPHVRVFDVVIDTGFLEFADGWMPALRAGGARRHRRFHQSFDRRSVLRHRLGTRRERR